MARVAVGDLQEHLSDVLLQLRLLQNLFDQPSIRWVGELADWSNQGTALAGHKAALPYDVGIAAHVPGAPPYRLIYSPGTHPGGNPGATLKSISHRCHPILVAFVWALTEETIDLALGYFQGGEAV